VFSNLHQENHLFNVNNDNRNNINNRLQGQNNDASRLKKVEDIVNSFGSKKALDH